MKKKLLTALIGASCAGISASYAAPVVTTMSDVGGPTAEDMVNSLLAGGSGISIVSGSVSYTGASNGSGTFTNGGTNQANSIGIESGIILTSGDAHFVASVPNTNGGAGTDNSASGSALLNSVGAGTTYNASVLSFKFVPDSNKVKFSYVFGSEEYNNYVNSQYNDVFGFFVNGVNYALIPGTNTPVSINNVNCGGPTSGAANGVNASNCAYFRDNPPNTGSIDTQLDGMTVILTFVADVVAGAENLIQLGIADVSDTALDSAVFIQGGSFSTCGGPNQPPCDNNVPEPSAGLLAALGLLGLAAMRKGRRS